MPTSDTKRQMEEAVMVLREDLRTLRPGRASAELVTSLPVAAYGQTMLLNQVAGITNDEKGNLIITPWDKSVTAAIENAVRSSQLGFSVVNNGAALILGLPALTQERRQELAKVANQKGEAARVRLRQIRAETHQVATRQKANGEIREDELARLTKELNDLIEKQNIEIKIVVEQKEKELLAI